MGSSMKKKRDKKKDFQKPKLKVGKAKAKADNFTDTSFKAKSIVVNQQSLSTTAPSSSAQFSHYLSLASSSRSETQRRDALAYLTSQISAQQPDTPLPVHPNIILPKLLPLILDGSQPVRTALHPLLSLISSPDISAQAETFLLYIRAGMTHLASSIRSDALNSLDLLLSTAADAAISCPGGWVKTLNCFMTMLSWSSLNTTKPSSWSTTSRSAISSSPAAFPKQLTLLKKFLAAGLLDPPDNTPAEPYRGFGFLRIENRHLMMPTTPNPFAHLNLFGRPRDEEGEMYVDREGRQRVFKKRFEKVFAEGIERARKDGGETGRAAAALSKVVKEGMEDFEGDVEE
ncbi:Rix1 complex component [Bisporella sp. PMI_857]|nr:Rix1 complex component [Bisporella sp. PMI_857]